MVNSTRLIVRFNTVQEGGRVHERLVHYVLIAYVMVGVHSIRELEASWFEVGTGALEGSCFGYLTTLRWRLVF
jgi:hypothetical protein